MTEAVYAVLLHGEHIGTIQRRDTDTTFTIFTFDRDYWDRPDRRVLGRWFEDHPRKRPRANNRVPAWFSNLLPEGRLRELIAREQGVNAHREMDLLERIGADLPGAAVVTLDPNQEVDATFDDAVAPQRPASVVPPG
ncbi:HipA N-terminal domain-containing protein, partial [Actinomyces sp. 217892]